MGLLRLEGEVDWSEGYWPWWLHLILFVPVICFHWPQGW